MNKGLLIGGITILVAGAGLLIWQHAKGDGGGGNDPEDNFKALLKNLGGQNKPDAAGSVVVPFNSQKNQARFYNNNRVAIFEGQKQLGMGTYTNGGLTITMDGKAPIVSASVFNNLLKTI